MEQGRLAGLINRTSPGSTPGGASGGEMVAVVIVLVFLGGVGVGSAAEKNHRGDTPDLVAKDINCGLAMTLLGVVIAIIEAIP